MCFNFCTSDFLSMRGQKLFENGLRQSTENGLGKINYTHHKNYILHNFTH